MKIALIASLLSAATPAIAHAQFQSAEDLTRLLNGGPAAAARPAPPQPEAQRPAPARPATVSTAPSSSTPRSAPPAAPSAPVVQNRAATSAAPSAPAQAQRPAPATGALGASAVAALPFRIELPGDVQLFEGRGAPDAKVWSVRKGTRTLAMIYAGPSSQFPIYDGEQVTAAGRVSVIVPEGTRRIAMEHWFQRPVAPTEIHVWLMSLDGADRDAAERIAQSVDPK